MRTKALYFPYINLPNDSWLYLMLLYWDQLSSIVPSEYLHDPEKLSPHMTTLMRAGLVNPLTPTTYIPDMKHFGKPFVDFVQHRVRKRYLRNSVTTQKTLIHIEKLGPVADELVRLELARPTTYPWYEMDHWVANAFMSYLASVLGSLPNVESAPVTNDESCFHLLAGYERSPYSVGSRERQLVLEAVFPFPKQDLSLKKLLKFRQKYGEEMARFRNKIEGLCVDLSDISDQNTREEKRHLTVQEMKQDIEYVSARMQETWREVVLLDVLPILGIGGSVIASLQGDQMLGAGLGALSLSSALCQFFKRNRDRELLLNHPMAYGALLRRQWPSL